MGEKPKVYNQMDYTILQVGDYVFRKKNLKSS